MRAAEFLQGDYTELPKRGLTKATCAKWGYSVGKDGHKPVQIANYRDPDNGEIVGQKVRDSNKDFYIVGDLRAAGLYGRHLWRDGGRRVVITEGELDALSVSQVLDHRWPVVSLPNGAQGAKKAIADNLVWLNQFEHVALCFDMDEPGRRAVKECASILPPGKAQIVHLPLKDASEMLQAERSADLVKAIWEAPSYRPDGLVTIGDVRERVMRDPEEGLPWTFPALTEITYGRRYGECVGLGAGTGVGKTTFLTQQISDDLAAGHSVGAFLFEQHPAETVKRIAGQRTGRTYHIPRSGWTEEELDAAVDDLVKGPALHLYDHFGSCDWTVVKERIRFLAHAHGVRIFYLDHLTALAAAEDDERRAIEKIMAELGGIVKELDIWLLFVSHLATPEGKPHEEGGRVMSKHFKGSRSIGYWSHFMFGMERNKSADDEAERMQTVFRCLKDRNTGQADGFTLPITYDRKTGRLVEGENSPFGDGTAAF